MKRAFFDCFAGASGDMIIGAFLDAGFDFNLLKGELKKLKIPGYEISAERCMKKNISASKFNVRVIEPETSRNFSDIRLLISSSDLHPSVKGNAISIFEMIAQAESRIHNINIESVHFHEIGAVDSIIDICAAAICFHHWEITEAASSPVNTGSGLIKTDHGMLPVPAPATAEILKGIPVYSSGADGELTTPTGAAIIKHFCRSFSPLPEITFTKIGYGAGTKDFTFPNVMRLFISDINTSEFITDEVIEIETAIDDMNPEFYSYLFEKLLSAGALDINVIPVVMKKNRPGHIIKVLSAKESSERIIQSMFMETSTTGMRINTLKRRILEREPVIIDTEYGPIGVKIHRIKGVPSTVSPEYEDCRAAAIKHNVPLKMVYNAAVAKAYSLF